MRCSEAILVPVAAHGNSGSRGRAETSARDVLSWARPPHVDSSLRSAAQRPVYCGTTMSTFLVPDLFLPLLCDHLRELGYDAVVDAERTPRGSWPGSDLGYLALKGGPTDLLAVTNPGLSSMRLSNWSHTTSIGRLPISARKVVPVEYHFILRFAGLLSRDTFEARFRGPAKHPSWRGGRLAELLETDGLLAASLGAELKPHERFLVRADPRRGFVRIVCETSLRAGFSLFPTPKLELESGLPSHALLSLVDRVVQRVRAFL
jgi:hypothetical protein